MTIINKVIGLSILSASSVLAQQAKAPTKMLDEKGNIIDIPKDLYIPNEPGSELDFLQGVKLPKDTEVFKGKDGRIQLKHKSGKIMPLPDLSSLEPALDKGQFKSSQFAPPTQLPISGKEFASAYSKWEELMEKQRKSNEEALKDVEGLDDGTFDPKNITKIGAMAGRKIVKTDSVYTGIPINAIVFVPENLSELVGGALEAMGNRKELDANDFINQNPNKFHKVNVRKGLVPDPKNAKQMIQSFVIPKSAVDFAKSNSKILIATLQNGLCGHKVVVK